MNLAPEPRGETDPRLNALRSLVLIGAQQVRQRSPELPDLGGCVFLGKHYARPDCPIVFLGINPGESPNQFLDTDLPAHNALLEGPNPAGHSYWTNARKFFNHDSAVRRAFGGATFGFCSPYRTTSWKGLSDEQRAVLIEASRPALRQLLDDCRPELVVVAGKSGLDAFEEMLRGPLRLSSEEPGGRSGGTYQWGLKRGSCDGRPVRVAKVPHFSRANSAPRLAEAAQWLRGVMSGAGVL